MSDKKKSILPKDAYTMMRKFGLASFNLLYEFQKLNVPYVTLLLVIFSNLVVTNAFANSETCANSNDADRRIIALIDQEIESDFRLSRIHKYMELPLNHLGYKVEYILGTELDEAASITEGTAAIISWLDAKSEIGNRLAAWRLAALTPCGVRPVQIVLGDTGVTVGQEELEVALLKSAGVRLVGTEKPVGHLSRVEALDDNLIGFETDYLVGLGAYPNFRNTGGAKSFLSVSPFGNGDSIDLVVIGESGAYAHSEALVDYDPRLGSALWILNPFSFLEQALAANVAPIADTTTRNGERLFFATVSADGWLEAEPSRYFGQNVEIGGEALLRNFVVPYSDIPMTVSIALGDLDPALAGPNAQRARNAAETVFSNPNVSAATVGHDFVRDWRFVATASQSIGDSGQGSDDTASRMLNAARRLGAVVSGRTPAASQATYRKYFSTGFDLFSEIASSVESLDTLLPAQKSADAVVWSRNSFPPEDALATARDAGVVAIGGGWEPGHPLIPTLASMTPFSAEVGDELQIYDPLPSDATFSSNWTADLVGLHGLRKTVSWSDNPRRIAPFQLSISARAALFFPTVSAVRGLLEEVRSGAYAPISTREYVGIVRGFHSVRFRNTGKLSWQVLDRGELQTVRFDSATNLALDFSQSSGVLGATRKGATLYVSLDPGASEPTLALASDAAKSGVKLGNSAIALAKSNLLVSGFGWDQCRATLDAYGMSAGHIEVITHPGNIVKYAYGQMESEVVADEFGRARIEVSEPGSHTIIFETTCGEG